MAKPRQKSRSGCRTCKLRKVKCDETRPICKRCTLADRTCEGYGIWGGGHVRVVKSRQFPESELTGKPRCLQFLPLQADERRCFEWYMLRSTTKLDGIFFSPKLANLMLQASVSEPAVLHALLSLGSCHMEEVFQCKDGKQSMVTFKQYNKAIGFLTPKIDGAHTNALRASLMVCTLFTLMEPLRGCYVAGLLHLEYGLKLLSCLKGVIMSSEFDFWMVTTLSRHIVQAKLFGQLQHVSCRDLIELGNESDTPLFRSVHHAGWRLDVVAMSMFELKDGHIEDDKLVACRQQLDVDIQLWEDTYLATVRPDMQVMEAFSYDLLRCYHRVIRVMAVAGQDPENEMLYDSCTSDFIAIIEFCIAAYLFTNVAPDSPKGRSHRDVEDCSPNSITEIGWIAPLYFTAIKCRFPRLRRQALSLLKLLPHREGCFETNLCCEIAHEVIAIEEIGRYCSITFEDFMLSDPISNATQPSLGLTDKHRLRRLALKLPEDKTGTLKLEGVRGTDAISRKFNLQTETWHSPVQNWRP